ncbi:GNAT family N-acetyltransferase [Lacticaseibacillus porcinae]|uniref:GNAT family N-acetyltransferase n=1 Tax=Lacticaseibacillus porcinae TaxID=1123687 RepID=UPI000F7841EB
MLKSNYSYFSTTERGNSLETTVTVTKTNDLSPKTLLEILAVRTKVFVVEQNCAYQEVDAKDFDAWHVQLRQAGELVAYARIIPHDDGQSISFGRVLVVESHRREQLGRKLVTETLATVRRLYPDQQIKIQAQNYLREFYGSFGFQPVSDVYLEDGIPHVDMVMQTF